MIYLEQRVETVLLTSPTAVRAGRIKAVSKISSICYVSNLLLKKKNRHFYIKKLLEYVNFGKLEAKFSISLASQAR